MSCEKYKNIYRVNKKKKIPYKQIGVFWNDLESSWRLYDRHETSYFYIRDDRS